MVVLNTDTDEVISKKQNTSEDYENISVYSGVYFKEANALVLLKDNGVEVFDADTLESKKIIVDDGYEYSQLALNMGRGAAIFHATGGGNREDITEYALLDANLEFTFVKMLFLPPAHDSLDPAPGFSADGKRAYVFRSYDTTLRSIDLNTNTVQKTVVLPYDQLSSKNFHLAYVKDIKGQKVLVSGTQIVNGAEADGYFVYDLEADTASPLLSAKLANAACMLSYSAKIFVCDEVYDSGKHEEPIKSLGILHIYDVKTGGRLVC